MIYKYLKIKSKLINNIVIISFFIFICNLVSYSQSKTDIEYFLQTNKNIFELTVDQDDFNKHYSALDALIFDFFLYSNIKRTLYINFTFFKKKEAYISVSCSPALSVDSLNLLNSKLKKLEFFNTQIGYFTILYKINIKGGVNTQTSKFSPALMFYSDLEKSYYIDKDFNSKLSDIQNWVNNVALTLLELKINKYAISDTDLKLYLNKVFNQQYTNRNQIINLTENNENYWNLILNKPNIFALISTLKICLHVGVKDIDYAYNFLDPVYYFSIENSIENYILQELYWRINFLFLTLEQEILIAKHSPNQGNILKLNKIYPYSSFIKYNLYLRDSVKFSKKEIYKYNLFVQYDIVIDSQIEAYKKFRRNQIHELFNIRKNYVDDFYKLAIISIDLENYALSAHLFGLLYFSAIDEKYNNRNTIKYFLYCLDKLEIKSIRRKFSSIKKRDFKQIDKKRIKNMNNHSIYKNFKK